MPKSFRNDIQGLRAIAVGLVLIFHAFPHILPGGFVGVDVFFVISGFVITKSLIRDIENNGLTVGPLMLRFYRKRVRRILPVLSVTLIATLSAGWLLLFPSDYFAVAKSALYSAVGAGNFYFFWNSGYFDPAAAKQPLLHMWSLGVEEQFYLVWPVVLALILWVSNSRRAVIAAIMAGIIGIGFAYNVGLIALDPKAAFYLPAARAWELGAGATLAFAPAIRWRLISEFFGIAGLILILWASIWLTADETSTGWPMLPVIIGTAMLVWPRAESWTARLLEISPLRAIGAISFSLYLWHWPLISFATMLDVDTAVVRAAIIPFSVLLSAATYLLVEKPALDGRWIRIAIPASLLSTAAASAFAGAIVLSGGAPVRFPAEIRPVLALSGYDPETKTRFPACWLNETKTFSDYYDECGKGPLLIWGDSHAAMLYPGLNKMFGDVAEYTRNGCMPLVDDVYPACAAGNRAILQKINEEKPKTVILFAAWLNYPVKWGEEWPFANALRQTIRGLHAAGIEDVLVLGPAPFWDPALPTAAFTYWSEHGLLPAMLKPSDRPHEAANETLNHISTTEGARFLSVYDALCDQGECRTHTPRSASELISWDYGHFTWQGAEYVAHLLFRDRH